jgi:hypothetical protein
MTEQEKQAIEKRFKLITKYINYDEAIVLGSILGKMFSALDERDWEVERLAVLDNTNQEIITALADQLEKERADFKKLFYENQRLHKALENITQDHLYSYDMRRITRQALTGR